MRHCASCAVHVEGTWNRCPLCGASLHGQSSSSPFPAIPLRFSRRRVLRILLLSSVVLIIASVATQLVFNRWFDGIGVFRFVWLGVIAMWSIVLMAVRKRHNVAKGTVYLVVLLGLVCVYWDYLTGWRSWSLTYAVPIICASAVLSVQILVRVMRVEVGDHVLYTGLTAILGLVPFAFYALGWVSHPLPSLLCGALSLLSLALLQITRGGQIRGELAKRLDV